MNKCLILQSNGGQEWPKMPKIMDKRPLIGIAVMVVKEDRVLLGKRKNSHGSGTWAFPGGHLEFNESIQTEFSITAIAWPG